MFHIIIIFFFILYVICELTKYRKIASFKAEKKIYNKPVVYIKFIAIVLTFILLVINRFLKIGIMDRSNTVFNGVFYYVVIALLIGISIRDIKMVSA